MEKQFTAVSFPRQYPQSSVADHEILMSFVGDSDAANFYEWWHEDGAMRFAKWLAKKTSQPSCKE